MRRGGDRRGDRLRDAVQLAVLGFQPRPRRSLRRHRRRILQRLPVVIEFSACIALFALFASPWPLPAWRARASVSRDSRSGVSSTRFARPVVSLVGEAAATTTPTSRSRFPPGTSRYLTAPRRARDVRGPFAGGFPRFVSATRSSRTCWRSAGLMLWQSEFTLCLFATSSWTAAEAQKRQGAQCAGRTPNALYAKPLAIALPFWVRLSQCFGSAREDAAAGNRTRAHARRQRA